MEDLFENILSQIGTEISEEELSVCDGNMQTYVKQSGINGSTSTRRTMIAYDELAA